MDKRILLSIAVMLLSSIAIAAYRTFFYKHDGIHATITPRGVLHVNDSISFHDLTAGASRRIWDFGDGEFSTSEAGHHTFLTPGKFRIRLRSHGTFGTLADSSTEVIVLGNESAAPMIKGPEMVIAGQEVAYESPITAETYEWRIEGDAAMASAKQTTSIASYQFSVPGKKTVVVATHNPDQNFRKNILVQASAPAPVVASTPAPTRPAEKPRNNPAPRPKPARTNSAGQPLPDIGQGVIID